MRAHILTTLLLFKFEQDKKKDEFNNRPVPLEWQVERYEQVANKRHDEYLKKLEIQVKEAKRQKAEEEKYKQVWSLYSNYFFADL